MRPAEMLAIDGVFPAVKCAICSTVYDAGNDDFVAFHGPVTAGLDDEVIGWSAPHKPKRRSITVVCRTPECQVKLVRRMLRCSPEDEGSPDELWLQALRIWATAAGHELSGPPEKEPPKRATRRKRT
jgi:hypothetical protein